MTQLDINFASITELEKLMRSGATSAEEICNAVFRRIEEIDSRLHSFVTVTFARALKEARASDLRRRSDAILGPLDGIPYAVKDLFDVEGEVTAAGTSLLHDNLAQHDCNVVQRLSSAGMVLIGKVHTVEFACRINGVNIDLGTPQNPWSEIPHIPGGSSSGSAVAVASGIVPVALGTDTGGSIRVPSSMCGVTGFKPTTGRVGRSGVHPGAWSLDAVGPIARSANDAALVFSMLDGNDVGDETTWQTPHLLPEFDRLDLNGLKVLICESIYAEECDPAIWSAVEQVGAVITKLGAKVERGPLLEITEARKRCDQGVIIETEAYAANARLLDLHLEQIDPQCHWMIAGKTLAAKDYHNALRERAAIQSRFRKSMVNYDAFIAPVVAGPTMRIADILAGVQPDVSYSRNTMMGNYLNLSEIAFPCGLGSDGFPIGAMFCAPAFEENTVLSLAHAYQSETDWHLRRPDLSWIA